MAFVSEERWRERAWTTDALRLAADGRPELACTLWGLPVRKRLLAACVAHQAIDGGRRFDLSADARLEWAHAAGLAAFETEAGELAHLAEGGAHVSCLRLTRLPETCVWQHALEYPAGTQFLHQPALTAHELAEGCVRPPAVVGSYAVRAPDDGRKVAHIPRPVAVDARGERVWGSIEIAAGLSTVRFDRAALRNRLRWGDDGIVIYGLDTFGYTSIGGTEAGGWQYNRMISVGDYQPSSSGDAVSITAYTKTSGAVDWQTALYADSGGVPAALLAADTTGDVNSTTPGWKTRAFDAPVSITSGTTYWITHVNNGWGSYWYDSDASYGFRYKNITYDSWPNPAGTTSPASDLGHGSRRVSVYCTYTPSVTGNPWWLYQHASLGVQ